MEKKYIKKRIKKELIKKNFSEWNKESIQLLTHVYKYNEYNNFYESNLLLLDNYIRWYKKSNKKPTDMYALDKLICLSCLIKEDLFYEKNYDYNSVLYSNVNSVNNLFFKDIYDFFSNDTFYSFGFGLIIAIIYNVLKFLLQKEEYKEEQKEKKKTEFQIPINIPDNIMNNPLIKELLNHTFLT